MNTNSSLFKSSHRAHLRIADILLLDEDEEEEAEGRDSLLAMDGCAGIISRWVSRLRRAKVNRQDQNVAQNTKCSTNLLNGGDLPSPVPHNDQSGACGCRRESSFNMGVGCSLLYLIAASKNELDKMTELRTQMEMLLQNFKEELQVRNTLVKPSEGMRPNCHCSSQKLMTTCVQPESSTTAIMMCEQSLKFDSSKEEECLEGIDQLQAELEAELERLQLHLGEDKLLQHPQQQSIEVTVKDTASTMSHSLSYGEVIDPVMEPQEACTEGRYNYGVPPHELERRLHELLESRQQEQIKELEVALECVRHELHDKEMEISWWKDTARLVSKHVPGPSRHITERG